MDTRTGREGPRAVSRLVSVRGDRRFSRRRFQDGWAGVPLLGKSIELCQRVDNFWVIVDPGEVSSVREFDEHRLRKPAPNALLALAVNVFLAASDHYGENGSRLDP